MIDAETAIDRGKWYECFVQGDLDGVRARLAPDVLRIGPRSRDANHRQVGREAYIDYMADLHKTMPCLGQSVIHSVTPSPDGQHVFLHITERDSLEPGSRTELIDVSCIIMCQLNDEALVQVIDIYWKEPETDYEWAGTTED